MVSYLAVHQIVRQVYDGEIGKVFWFFSRLGPWKTSTFLNSAAHAQDCLFFCSSRLFWLTISLYHAVRTRTCNPHQYRRSASLHYYHPLLRLLIEVGHKMGHSFFLRKEA